MQNANVVICKRKPKLQHLLMCHVTAQGMELRMQEGDAIQPRKFLDNSPNEETARYAQFSDARKRLINTSMVAKSGMVLHGIAFSKHLQLTNSECSWARALQDLYPDSYRLLFTTGSFTSTTSQFSNESDVQPVQRFQ